LCLLFRPKTVHCSTKNAYTSEITFLALVPCLLQGFWFALLDPKFDADCCNVHKKEPGLQSDSDLINY